MLARLAHFAGTPVILAARAGEESWLAERLARFGELPAAVLIASEWFGRRVAWFDRQRLHGTRLGVIQVE